MTPWLAYLLANATQVAFNFTILYILYQHGLIFH